MARRRDGSGLLTIGLLGGGLWLTLRGKLGEKAQREAAGILQNLWGKCQNAGGDLASMVSANPNFVAQMWAWKAERISRLESPYEWEAFRTHLKNIGAPDPGSAPPREFCQ